jgi:hypothetical protein
MTQHLATWWSSLLAFLAAPLGLLSLDTLALIPALGIVFGLVGIYLAVTLREKQSVWLLPPFVLATLAPVIIYIAEDVMGWVGMSFVMFVGLICLVIWISILAHDATRRLPVWLIGLSLMSYVAWCGTYLVIIPHWL